MNIYYIFILLFLVANVAMAVEVEWNQKGTAWDDPNNWSTGTVPGPEDLAVFPAKDAVKNQPTVTGVVWVGGIKFDNGTPVNDKIIVPGVDKSIGSFTWIINGTGNIIVGKYGIRVTGGNSLIYPSLELAANQPWDIGRPALVYPDTRLCFEFYYQQWARHWDFLYCEPHCNLVVCGTISGRGSIRKVGQGRIFYANNDSPTFSGGASICEGTICWMPQKLTPTGEYTFGSSPLALDSGRFFFEAKGSTPESIARLTNPIRVASLGGEVENQKSEKTGSIFNGPLELGGFLRIGMRPYNNVPAPAVFDGPSITLSQREPACPGFAAETSCFSHRLPMPITDGPGDAGNPLIFEYADVISLLSPKNSYAGPTIVSFMSNNDVPNHLIGVVNAAPGCKLGKGDLIVQPGGRIHLSAKTNLSPNAEAHVESNPISLGVLGVGYNGIPKISPDSAGVLAVDYEKFDAVTNLSRLGNGRMFLGSRDKGTFTGASLAPGKGNVYRLGGGSFGGIPGRGWPQIADLLASGSNPGSHYAVDHWIFNPSIMDRQHSPGNIPGGGLLTIEHSVLQGNADVTVGAMSRLGNGTILLKSAQNFTGKLTVQGLDETPWISGFVWRGSLLEGVAQPQAGASPFGSSRGPVHLFNSTIKLTGFSGGQPIEKGPLTFTGLCNIGLDANTTNIANLTLAKMVRDSRAVLTIDPAQELLGDQERLINSDWKADSDLLPPWLLYSSTKRWCGTWDKDGYHLDPNMSTGPDFLTYDAVKGTGFRRFTSYATNLATATEKDVVKIGAGTMPEGSHTVRALKVTGDVNGKGSIKILNGGLILGGDLAADIDFGPVEGVIYSADLGPNKRNSWYMIMDVKGKISGSNGVTVTGGPLPHGFDWSVPGSTGIQLSSAQNDFNGPLTVNGVSLYALPDREEKGVFTPGSFGDLKNDIELNGGYLFWCGKGNCIAPSRTIHLGPGGGYFGGGGAESRIFIHAKITGPGFLGETIEGGTPIVITNSENDYSGGTWVNIDDDGNESMETVVTGTGKLGTGPVMVGKDTALLLQGDNNIDPVARLYLALTGLAVFTSAHPAIGSLDGCGLVYLGTKSTPAILFEGTKLPELKGRDTALIIGSDNTDFTFYGSIRQMGEQAGDGIGSITKIGKGIFTLHGGHKYTGPTTVDEGLLNLMGNVAGDVIVKAAGALQGSGKISRVLTLEGGTLAVELSGPRLKPLQVTGTVKISGKLEVKLRAGFKPKTGQKWTILTVEGGITGKFTRVTTGYKVLVSGKTMLLEKR